MGIYRRLTEGMDFTFGTLSYDVPREPLITTATTATDASRIYPVDTSGGAVTITLASSMVSEGAHLTVNDEGGSAGTSAITIDTEGSETIDDSASQSIGSNYGALALYSDGVDWYTQGSTGGGGTL